MNWHKPPPDEPVDYYDLDAPTSKPRRFALHGDWLAMALAILAQVGVGVWWGGRLAQRVETLEDSATEFRRGRDDLNADNSRQNVTLGIIGQQYGEISRRLESIERKVDRR